MNESSYLAIEYKVNEDDSTLCRMEGLSCKFLSCFVMLESTPQKDKIKKSVVMFEKLSSIMLVVMTKQFQSLQKMNPPAFDRELIQTIFSWTRWCVGCNVKCIQIVSWRWNSRTENWFRSKRDENSSTDYWPLMCNSYPKLAERWIHSLLPFLSTLWSRTLLKMKTKQRSRLENVEIALCPFKHSPAYSRIGENKSNHWFLFDHNIHLIKINYKFTISWHSSGHFVNWITICLLLFGP